MIKKVMIKIISKCEELSDEIFDSCFGDSNFEEGDFDAIDYALEAALEHVADVKPNFGGEKAAEEDDGEMEICTEGRMRITGDRVSVTYDETEMTGMEGTKTMVGFFKSQPDIVTMTRTGTVKSSFTFEPKKRYICSYETPYMPFEMCIRTLSMDNRLETDGELSLEYVIEIRGATAEHNTLFMKLYDAD